MASHVGNITLRHRQNRFKNKRSNLNLLEELEENIEITNTHKFAIQRIKTAVLISLPGFSKDRHVGERAEAR